jgi:CubicO group peptidase (beta-lactamase class C family)
LNLKPPRVPVVVMLLAAAVLISGAVDGLAGLPSFYRSGLAQNGIVGSALVLMDGPNANEEFYGLARREPPTPVDRHTAFHWASITKTFTGIAVMQLRDRGLLKLDDPVVKYVPELMAVHNAYGPMAAITLRQLMSHSAGFRGPTWPWGGDKPWHPFEPTRWSQIVSMLPYTEIEFAPGSKYSYSNLGVVFLGQVIERLSGDDYEVYIDKNILKPLEMSETYFDRSPYFLLNHRSASWAFEKGEPVEQPFDFDTGITVSNGGLNSPVSDMEKYLRFLIGDQTRGERYEEVLPRRSLEDMFTPVLPVGESEAGSGNSPDQKDSIGLSFFIRDDAGLRLYGHSGGQNGFISHLYFEPHSKKGYLVVFNTDGTGPERNTRKFDIQLRDYLIAHFFRSAAH